MNNEPDMVDDLRVFNEGERRGERHEAFWECAASVCDAKMNPQVAANRHGVRYCVYVVSCIV